MQGKDRALTVHQAVVGFAFCGVLLVAVVVYSYWLRECCEAPAAVEVEK